MSSTERRQRERENLQRAILDAARDLFVEQGFAAVSLRKIADKIEYSPTAIYLYFKDKDEILSALIDEGFGLLCTYMQDIQTEDPVERLRQGAHSYFAFMRAHPQYYSLMFEMCDDDAEKALETKPESAARAFAFIRENVIAGMASGQFRTDVPEVVISHVFWANIHGAAALSLAHRLKMLPEEHHGAFFNACVETALRGILVW
jgi:AcrR family transcriptional regulator